MGRHNYRFILGLGQATVGGNSDDVPCGEFVFFGNSELHSVPLVLVPADHDVSTGDHSDHRRDSTRF